MQFTREDVNWMKRLLEDVEETGVHMRAEREAWNAAIVAAAKALGIGSTLDLFRASWMSRDEIVEALLPICQSFEIGSLLNDSMLRIRQFFALCGLEQWSPTDRLIALSRLMDEPQLSPAEFSAVQGVRDEA